MRVALRVGMGLLGLVAAPWLAAREQAPSSPAPQFPSGVELVTIDAVVLDKKGNPVEGLTRDDFTVAEDGRPQSLSSFEAVVLPEFESAPAPTQSRVSTNTPPVRPQERRTFVVVFDNVHMAPQRIAVARKAVDEFLRTALRPGDQVTLVPTSGGSWWTAQIPEGANDLAAALESLSGLRTPDTGVDRISDWEAMQLYLFRNKDVMAEVSRRYYEHRIILEPPGIAERAPLQLDTGLPLIQAKSAEVYHAALDRKKVTLGILERVADSLVSVKGRKSIVLVSEGFVYEPQLPEFHNVVRAGRRANAAVYFLDSRGLEGTAITSDAEIAEQTDPRDVNAVLNENTLAAQGADSIAIDTGGFSLKNTNNLVTGLRRIASESRSYYLLGYLPANTDRDGKFRKIEVRVGRPGVDVRSRRGYYAPKEGEAPTRKPDELSPAVRQALDSPYLGEGVPLRLTSYVLGAAAAGKVSVLLVAEADPASFRFEQRGDRFAAALESYVVVSARDTGENLNREKLIELSLPPAVKQQLQRSWLPMARDFELGPGVYQARVLLRDRQGGRIGTVRQELVVPPLDALRTSTPILTDALQPAPEGSRLPARPVPVAHRAFAVGASLYYVFEVFGASRDSAGTARVSAGYQVTNAAGAVLAKQPAQRLVPGPRGELTQVFTLSLQGLAPGDYAIGLRVQDEVAGKTIEVLDPFSAVAPQGAADAGVSRDRAVAGPASPAP
jgi:VWFA-related protein